MALLLGEKTASCSVSKNKCTSCYTTHVTYTAFEQPVSCLLEETGALHAMPPTQLMWHVKEIFSTQHKKSRFTTLFIPPEILKPYALHLGMHAGALIRRFLRVIVKISEQNHIHIDEN